jgi:hypothetical protein
MASGVNAVTGTPQQAAGMTMCYRTMLLAEETSAPAISVMRVFNRSLQAAAGWTPNAPAGRSVITAIQPGDGFSASASQ